MTALWSQGASSTLEVAMRKFLSLVASCAALCLCMAFASVAQAQLNQTWVASFGNDANDCSRNAPCRSFTIAITKTNVAGEIRCVDAGNYGSMLINKSITL